MNSRRLILPRTNDHTLSSTEVFRDLMKYPSSTIVRRLQRIKGKLTLDGRVAAKRFARELEG
jgi:hypothetical protein